MTELPPAALAELSEKQRAEAMRRWEVLRPHLEDDLPLARAAQEAKVAVRSAQRWLARYQKSGLVGLARKERADRDSRQVAPELVSVAEGLALSTPRLSVATITRRCAQVAGEHGWSAPSYSTIRSIVTGLDPALMTLAHEGAVAFRDRYELVYRHRAARPNDLWQADHSELDILLVDSDGRPARPWLTAILDDHSRAVAGYTVFLGAPSALNLSLALRQAIWHKSDPAWVVHGIPDVLYVDHGSDFTSRHITQVAADLHIQLIHSAVARPQGRGKVERLFGTITSEVLPELAGYLVGGKPTSPPKLTLPEFDSLLGRWITTVYHHRPHSETDVAPHQAWTADGWLPRRPDTLEALDLLLIMVATPRVVHRDGIHFQGLRYFDPTLAAYVRESVTIRYDPRDLAEIRVFHRNRFVCRAINTEHAGDAITLKDVQAARRARRQALRDELAQRRRALSEFLPRRAAEPASPLRQASDQAAAARPPTRGRRRLHTYREDRQ